MCQGQCFLASSALEDVIKVHKRSAVGVCWREGVMGVMAGVPRRSWRQAALSRGNGRGCGQGLWMLRRGCWGGGTRPAEAREGTSGQVIAIPAHICPDCNRICASRVGLTGHVVCRGMSPGLRVRGAAITIN